MIKCDALGDVMFTDSEVSSYSGSNVVIVGGSCINSAAAKVLGVSERTCGEAFTAATGVGEGQFLIKGVDGAYTEGKLALVVADEVVADTQNTTTDKVKMTLTLFISFTPWLTRQTKTYL